jgi:hypothetical protein
MKTFLLSIFFVVTTFILNAQDANKAICSSKSNLVKGVESGIIEMTLSEAVTKENVDKYAGYYKNIFSVTFDETKHIVTFKMLDNTSSNRRVILRFLSANQVQNVIVEGQLFLIHDFYENFLK